MAAWRRITGLVRPVVLLLTDAHGSMPRGLRRFLAAAADSAAARWREKDQGIWEIRGEPRDFLYSKLMCWVAVDRAIALASHLGAEDRVANWGTARDEIRADPYPRLE